MVIFYAIWGIVLSLISIQSAHSWKQLRKRREQLYEDQKKFQAEEKESRRIYIAAMKETYDLMILQLQYRDRWSDPDVTKGFEALDSIQKTLYDRIMALELIECGIKFEGQMKAPK